MTRKKQTKSESVLQSVFNMVHELHDAKFSDKKAEPTDQCEPEVRIKHVYARFFPEKYYKTRDGKWALVEKFHDRTDGNHRLYGYIITDKGKRDYNMWNMNGRWSSFDESQYDLIDENSPQPKKLCDNPRFQGWAIGLGIVGFITVVSWGLITFFPAETVLENSCTCTVSETR